MDTKRNKWVIVASSNSSVPEMEIKEAVRLLVLELSRNFGGLTYSTMTGTWCENATETREAYSPVNYEIAHKIELVTDNPKEMDYKLIQDIYAHYLCDIANWVHVEYSEVEGLHFSIEQLSKVDFDVQSKSN